MQQFHSPYNYAGNNPINNIDPSGMYAYNWDTGEYENSNGDVVSWDEVYGNNFEEPDDPPKKNQDKPKKYSIPDAGAFYAKAYHDGIDEKEGKPNNFSGLASDIDDFYNSFQSDMSGILLNGNGFLAGGGGIDFAFISVEGDGIFILITPRGGMGGDLSVSAGWIRGNSFLENPTGISLKGGSMSSTLGALGITVGAWTDYNTKEQEIGNVWEGTIGQFTLGSKTVVGGNWSVGHTSVIKVFDYGKD